MPELPEVETIRRQLEPEIAGRRIERLEVLDPRWSRPVAPAVLGDAVSGRRIESLGRRGKYLLLRLEGGETLVMHLRMTGNLLLVDGESLIDPAEGRRLYRGSRRPSRGTCVRCSCSTTAASSGSPTRAASARRSSRTTRRSRDRFDGRVGLEPLSEEFTPEALGALAAGRSAPLKSFLLNQAAVAGIGNIYADEALFRARLHPLSPAGSMKPEHLEALHDAIRRCARGRDRRGRRLDRRLPRRPRRAREHAGRVPRPHPRGRALPALRVADRADRRRRPLDLLLPRLPGAAAAAAAEAEMSVEPPARLRHRSLERRRGGDRLHGGDPAAGAPAAGWTSAAAGPGPVRPT